MDGAAVCDSKTLVVKIMNPCTSTTFITPVVNNQTVFLDESEPLLVDVQFFDSVSLTQGNQDGLSFCGARAFTFSEPELVKSSGDSWQIAADSNEYNL